MKQLQPIAALVIIALICGCYATKQPNHPGDENMRYMYITCWPDETRLTVRIEFKDNTPIFHDERITREHEPIVYSVDRRKAKIITIKAEKYGWISQTRKWEGEIPFDVFLKLQMRF